MTDLLKIAHVTFSGLGGAGIAARRISDALNRAGHHSDFIVAQDPPTGGTVSPRMLLQTVSSKVGRAALRLYLRRERTIWTNNIGPGTLPKWFDLGAYDMVNLHWMGEGFLPVNLLAHLSTPVVWTLHDMWPFTGGCHYSNGCRGFEARCGRCPILGSTQDYDLSRLNWHFKSRAFRKSSLFLVAPSAWLADSARRSTALGPCQIRVIRNTVDVEVFRPRDSARLRQEMGLPTDGRLVLIGTGPSDKPSRKGAQFVRPLMDAICQALPGTPVTFVTFGNHTPQDRLYSLGILSDEEDIAKIYSAVDLFLLPTTEDNLPNTIAESAAAGTPAAAFAVGGIPEMISHQETGVLAPPFDVEALALASSAVLADTSKLSVMSAAARNQAKAEYKQEEVSKKYLNYYKYIINGQSKD